MTTTAQLIECYAKTAPAGWKRPLALVPTPRAVLADGIDIVEADGARIAIVSDTPDKLFILAALNHALDVCEGRR